VPPTRIQHSRIENQLSKRGGNTQLEKRKRVTGTGTGRRRGVTTTLAHGYMREISFGKGFKRGHTSQSSEPRVITLPGGHREEIHTNYTFCQAEKFG